MACCSEIFDHVDYATTNVPSYPCGQIGFVVARKKGNDPKVKIKGCDVPVRTPSFQKDLKWYNPQMHRRAFVLPQFMKVELHSPDVNISGRIGGNVEDDDDVNTNHDYYREGNEYDEEEGDRCFFAGCSIQ
jgi:hypothetical protein